MVNERGSLQDRCDTKVSKTVENVRKEFSKAIGDVIQQFAGATERQRKKEREKHRERKREHNSKPLLKS